MKPIEAGFHGRKGVNLNIPHLEDGSIDEEYFQEILEGQLRGVNNKISVGAIQFVDPVGIAST